MSTLVRTIDLAKRYRLGGQDVRALNGVSLEIEAGEFVAIMGRSGSGKSTLLNLIGCLDTPDSGSVFLGGTEITRLSERELPRVRREKVAFVFQHFNLIPTLTALENVMLPLGYARVPRDEATRRTLEILDEVGMRERARHRPAELSGGEQQRVAIARALVNRPVVVLADEPTGELDSETALSVLGLMRRLNLTLGQTFLLVTHDPMVAGLCTRVIRLKDGRVESDTGKRPVTVPP